MTERDQAQPRASTDTAWLAEGLAPVGPGAGPVGFSYRIVDTPLGHLLIARTSAGLVRVAFAREGFARVIEGLSEVLQHRPTPARSSLDEAARAIDAYFAGQARVIGVPLDLRLAIGFRRAVMHYLPSIAYGCTASYAQVAAAVGRSDAAYEAGVACRSNPLPIVLPCHRAVRSDRSIGGYLGGTEAKRVLLALEAA